MHFRWRWRSSDRLRQLWLLPDFANRLGAVCPALDEFPNFWDFSRSTLQRGEILSDCFLGGIGLGDARALQLDRCAVKDVSLAKLNVQGVVLRDQGRVLAACFGSLLQHCSLKICQCFASERGHQLLLNPQNFELANLEIFSTLQKIQRRWR
jgi:hypothetical protein